MSAMNNTEEAPTYFYRFTKEQSDFIKRNSMLISYGGKRYFKVPDWFIEEFENVFRLVSEENLPHEIKKILYQPTTNNK